MCTGEELCTTVGGKKLKVVGSALGLSNAYLLAMGDDKLGNAELGINGPFGGLNWTIIVQTFVCCKHHTELNRT